MLCDLKFLSLIDIDYFEKLSYIITLSVSFLTASHCIRAPLMPFRKVVCGTPRAQFKIHGKDRNCRYPWCGSHTETLENRSTVPEILRCIHYPLELERR